MIVPLFALANIGIAIDGDFLSQAYTSPITLGIIVGYVLGKPVGIVGSSWLVTVLTRGRIKPPLQPCSRLLHAGDTQQNVILGFASNT